MLNTYFNCATVIPIKESMADYNLMILLIWAKLQELFKLTNLTASVRRRKM